jgi:hypothetical protein
MSRARAFAARTLGAALAVLLVPAPAGAREVWSRGEASVEVTGSIKTIGQVTGGTDASRFDAASRADPRCALAASFDACSAFDLVNEKTIWQSLTRARLRLDVKTGEHLSGVLVYDHEWLFGTLDTLGGELGETFRTDPFLDLDWDVKVAGLPTDHSRWRHRLYRGFLHAEYGKAEATVGRQRIPWGVGRLWNPVDRFNAIPPLAIEADQSLGVDAVDARWNFNGFHFLEGVYQPGTNSQEDAWGVRFRGAYGEMDYSLLAGRWESDWALGMDAAGNLGDAAFRIEAIWTRPTRDVWLLDEPRPGPLDDFWQVVVSLDYNVPVGKGLYVLVEHLYNGNALGFGRGAPGTLRPFFEARGPFVTPASPAVFGGSRVLTLAENQTGLQLGYDLTPILRADFLSIADWNGLSAVFAPILTYSPVGSIELTLGAQIFVGPRLSQYGSSESLGYFMAQWFF